MEKNTEKKLFNMAKKKNKNNFPDQGMSSFEKKSKWELKKRITDKSPFSVVKKIKGEQHTFQGFKQFEFLRSTCFSPNQKNFPSDVTTR